jgi:peptidoglycan/xylan/chitin deacetylase (PgdA/CDA1 family)
MAADEEERELARAREALDVFGATVSGYRAPGWACSLETIALIARHGFSYSSNFMDDIQPYVHEGTDVVELPVSRVLDDAPHFWFDADSWDREISTPSEVREIWQAELLGIREARGLAVMTFHPQVIGRPGRLRLLEDLIGWVLELGDVAAMTCAEVVEGVGLRSERARSVQSG